MSLGPIVTVPAEIEVPERLIGRVTVRMAGWLALAVLGATTASVGWPSLVLSGAGLTGLMVGISGAWATPGGRCLEAWLLPVLGFVRRVHRRNAGRAPSVALPARRIVRWHMGLRTLVPCWHWRWQRPGSHMRDVSRISPDLALAAILTAFLTLDVAVFTADSLRAPPRHGQHYATPSAAATPSDPAVTTAPAPFLLLLPGGGTP